MCRLFGFRSVIPSQVHQSLVAAENALGVQSERHPDGWGVAYYLHNAPHVIKSPDSALTDTLFKRVSGVVSSETVLAHVRNATKGETSLLNSHPFQFGPWTFAHNGDVRNFDRYKERILSAIAPKLRRFILGTTDSETLFFVFLSILEGYGPLDRPLGIQEVSRALEETAAFIMNECRTENEDHLLTMIATNGTTMCAHRGGKELFWATHKTKCPERDTCPSLAPECEAPTTTGFVNHLILSSEPLGGETVWQELGDGEMVGVNARMQLFHSEAQTASLPVVSQ